MLAFKKAIGMLELIISMVIISIIVLAIPRLISESTRTIGIIMQQETISINISYTFQILNRYWDENIVGMPNNAPILKIKQPTSHISNLNNLLELDNFHQENIDNNKKYLSSRRFQVKNELIFPESTRKINFGNVFDADLPRLYDDIDDYSNSKTSLLSNSANNNLIDRNISEFIDKNITISTTVTYASDDASTTNNLILKINNIFNNRKINSTKNILSSNINLSKQSIKNIIAELKLISINETIDVITRLDTVYIELREDINDSKIAALQTEISEIQEKIAQLSQQFPLNDHKYLDIRNKELEQLKVSLALIKTVQFYESNIKFIEVSIESNNKDEIFKKKITLYSFSCNIGTYYPEGKLYDFP